MPLPYAPPPKDSKVYRDLKNIKISSVTSTQMETLKGELFAQGVDGSEDEMRRLKLLGEVSNTQSDSGPISLHHVSETITGSAYINLKPPEEGMYQLQALSAEVSNQAGTQKYTLYYGNATDQTQVYWYYMTSSDTGVIFTADSNWPDFPLYFSQSHWLTVREFGTGTYDSMDFNCMFAKVR